MKIGKVKEVISTIKTNIGKVREAISIMQRAYDNYNENAWKNIDKDSDMYWYWKGIAEGTRRSWELLQELFNINEEEI